MRKAYLVGVDINHDLRFSENMEEMKNLAEACDIEIIKTYSQKLNNPHKKTYINQGKCQEILEALENEEEEIDVLLFDHEISPSQNRNLETYFDTKVLDKTGLILEIFALRAKSKEAKKQVEIARLKYMLPRLSGSYEGMDRQGGGMNNRGAGEKKIDLDTRNINERIKKLEREIETSALQRSTQMKRRKKSDIFHFSLVGYTNAGKSSLMNALLSYNEKEEKQVFEKDMLFATLTTNTRNIEFNKHAFLLSDTVGFVSDLPHTLVKAFHSTLEEALEADVLLEVIDFHDENYQNHMQVTKETLDSIGASDIPIVYIYNKCDLVDIEYPYAKEDHVYISCKDKDSITFLLEYLENEYFKQKEIELLIPYASGNVVSYLHEHASILQEEYKNEGIYIKCSIEDKEVYKVSNFIL